MNRRIAGALAAAGLLGGVSIVFVPQHAVSIARLLAATVAVVVAGLVLLAVVPVAARRPTEGPLDRLPSAGAAPLDPPGLLAARRDLRRTNQPGQLPEPVRQRLWTAATVHLHALGIDLDDVGQHPQAEAALGADTWARLTAPDAGRARAGTGGDTPALVHRVLDQLEQLTAPSDDLRGELHVHR